MRVLLVASWFPTPDSPVNGIFVAEQAKALSSDHEVTVLVPLVGQGPQSDSRRVYKHGDVSVVEITIPPLRMVHFAVLCLAVHREIRRHKAEIVHAHVTLPAGFASVIAARMAGIPSVITEHMGPFERLLGQRRERIKVWCALRGASAVIAVSGGLRKSMEQFCPAANYFTVPNLVDTNRFFFSPNTRAHKFRVLFVGRLNSGEKNLPCLLRALGALLPAMPYEARIVGEGALQASYEDLARSLKIDAQCHFVGGCSPDEVAAHLRWCDVLVLPSLHENCPVVVLEAQATGRPVIVTRCGGPEELICDDSGIAIAVNDHTELADSIVNVWKSPGRYAQRRISEYAEKRFGAVAVVRKISEIYSALTGHEGERLS